MSEPPTSELPIGAGPGASFEPPPTRPPTPGVIALHVSIGGLLDWVVEGAVVAITLGAALRMLEGPTLSVPAPVIVVVLAVLALMWAVLVRIEEPRSKRVRWDAWGITEEGAGVRVALAWAGARARVERSSMGGIAEVRDEQGRAIRVATGVLFSRALRQSACVASRRDFDAFAAAIARLPGHDAITTPALPISRVISAAWALPVALVVLAWSTSRELARSDQAPVFVGVPIALALASLVLPLLLSIAGVFAQIARARALRGARWVRVAGSAGEPLRMLRDDGTSLALVLDAPPSDARLGERGERARVLFDAARPDDEGPYRGREGARARALETEGERRDRVRVTGASSARALIAGAAIAVIAVRAVSYDPYAGVQSVITGSAVPRPAARTAWPIAPRPPETHGARSGPAPLEGRGGGYALRSVRRCDDDGVCENVFVVTVWETGEEIVCQGDEGRERCGRFTHGR